MGRPLCQVFVRQPSLTVFLLFSSRRRNGADVACHVMPRRTTGPCPANPTR
ncbi:hypothetical protein CCACVL1_21635 [Corchorus capsularis]|uniref:Uncharacterized protein n=1 Tax=Corchorus capsularis TaxID=210143 RepID=A0A1R3H306_COCAP|nr:hypothetical protein CCACVL1_21635 [Corchorus capsularis]